MKGMEMMVVNMLKGMGFDPDAIMRDVSQKVEQFEAGMKALNETLLNIQRTQERQEVMLRAICEHMSIEVPASNVTAIAFKKEDAA